MNFNFRPSTTSVSVGMATLATFMPKCVQAMDGLYETHLSRLYAPKAIEVKSSSNALSELIFTLQSNNKGAESVIFKHLPSLPIPIPADILRAQLAEEIEKPRTEFGGGIPRIKTMEWKSLTLPFKGDTIDDTLVVTINCEIEYPVEEPANVNAKSNGTPSAVKHNEELVQQN